MGSAGAICHFIYRAPLSFESNTEQIIHHIHSSLTAVWDWSKKWDLPINPTKCKYLTIVFSIGGLTDELHPFTKSTETGLG